MRRRARPRPERTVKNPIAQFLAWYRSLAAGQRSYLAHMYMVLTTENTSDLAMARDHSPERFERVVVQRDFPLRMVSKMVVIRSIIDFIFINKDQLMQETPVATSLPHIADKQWEVGLESWRVLRSVELSDRSINLWLRSELQAEKSFDA